MPRDFTHDIETNVLSLYDLYAYGIANPTALKPHGTEALVVQGRYVDDRLISDGLELSISIFEQKERRPICLTICSDHQDHD